MLTEGGAVVSGADINEMSDDELDSMVLHLNTCARSSPEHKMRIVDSLRRRNQVVAMTGDGVNDAPALKRADIGVAMGITGTDVTKQTADMVLTNDNFASIVSAIEEGRIIYSNIRKFVFYLISCNIGEILIIFLAMLAGLPSPLSPTMLLFLNLVSDGAPALALGMEKGEPGIMERPPRPAGEPIINREMLIGIAVQSVVMTVAILSSYLMAGAQPGASLNDPRPAHVADGGVRDPDPVRAVAGVHGPLRARLGVQARVLLQQDDEHGRDLLDRPGDRGDLRAVPAEHLRHGGLALDRLGVGASRSR